MFNIGDLVYLHKGRNFGGGIIVEISDRTAGPRNPRVYAYKIQFANSSRKIFLGLMREANFSRWFLDQDIELVSEAKTNV